VTQIKKALYNCFCRFSLVDYNHPVLIVSATRFKKVKLERSLDRFFDFLSGGYIPKFSIQKFGPYRTSLEVTS